MERPPKIPKPEHSLGGLAPWGTATLALATLATLFAQSHWLSDLLANLRIQQCLALLTMLLVCLTFRKWAWLAVTACCLAIHVPWFLPASPSTRSSRSQADPLIITVTNVLTYNQRHEDIVADVLSQNPDVFAVLELSSSLAEVFRSRCSDSYPHAIVRPMDRGNFGIGLYSRLPFEESEVFTLNTEIESISAVIQHRGKRFRIIATHPLPPIGLSGFQLRNEHLSKLPSVIRAEAIKDPETPIVLVGDLNLTPWSPHFARFENQSGLRRASKRFSITPTWYRYPMFPFGLVLDHALVSNGVACSKYVVGPDTGSDHRSVTVTLSSDNH